MIIYIPAALEGVEWITLQNPDQWETLFALSGPVGSGWRAPQVSFIRLQEDGIARQYSDCPWCLHTVLVIRGRALRSLLPVLEGYGEILPLQCDVRVSVFNATTIIDALDEERSSIARFADGEVMAIERHAFRPDAIGNAELFKLPGRASNIYLRETMVRRVGELGLSGLAFDMVWADETVAPGERRISYPGRDPA